MTLVTAEGKLVTVGPNETDEAKRDLFWAVRGGGGGNFGVPVKFKSKLHNLYDSNGAIVCGNLSWKLSQKEAQFRDMMEKFNRTDGHASCQSMLSGTQTTGRISLVI